MKIEKLKSGSYRIRKMYKGVTYTVVTDYKPTQKEAIRLLADEMDKTKTAKVRMTFKTAAEKYIDVKRNILSPSTIKGYAAIIRNLSDRFTKQIITDITSIDVQKEINEYAKTRSPKTVRNANGFISAVLGMFCPNTIISTTLPQKEKKSPIYHLMKMLRKLWKPLPALNMKSLSCLLHMGLDDLRYSLSHLMISTGI